jgi:hypothetical protein
MHIMPFNSLLLVSLVAETHFSEAGLKVSMTQEPGEKVLFFKMDQKSVRDSLGIKDGPICDGLVFYYRGNEKTCCFVELKGNKIDTAVKQIINTCNHLKQEINASLVRMDCQRHLTKISWKAYICSHSSLPKGARPYQKLLEGAFGKDNYSVGGESDLGLFLRKEKNRRFAGK